MINQELFVKTVNEFVSSAHVLAQGELRRILFAVGAEKLAKMFVDLDLAHRLAAQSQLRGAIAIGKALLPIAVECRTDARLSQCISFAAGMDITTANFFIWCARFVQFHMPTVRLSEEQFSAFACTDIDEDSLVEMKAPWPAFQIVFPANAFPVVVADNMRDFRGLEYAKPGESFAERITVSSFRGKLTDEEEAEFNAFAQANQIKGQTLRYTREGIWSTRVFLPQLCLDSTLRTAQDLYKGLEFEVEEREDRLALAEIEERATSIANRVALNTMLAMQQFKIDRTARKSLKARKQTAGGALPASAPGDEYRIGAPIVCNVGPSVRSYLRGETSRRNKVKWCVRGHWRNQPCGKKLTERKRAWVAPYYKGEGVKIIRDHVLA